MTLHVDILPRRHNTSIFFTDDELAILTGSSLHYLTTKLQTQVQDDYTRTSKLLFSQYSDLFPPNVYPLEEVWLCNGEMFLW